VVFGLSEVSTHGSVTFARLPSSSALALSPRSRCARGARRRRWSTCGCSRRGLRRRGATVFLVGAALFGSLLLLPLYFQIARGLSPLQAGLLMAPQGWARRWA
jgi:hypothetical protein